MCIIGMIVLEQGLEPGFPQQYFGFAGLDHLVRAGVGLGRKWPKSLLKNSTLPSFKNGSVLKAW